MANNLHFMTTGRCGREGCTCGDPSPSTGSETNSGSDPDSDMSQYEPTDAKVEEIAQRVEQRLEELIDGAIEDGTQIVEDGSDGETGAANSGDSSGSDVSLTANRRKFLDTQGLPTNWSLLEGVDFSREAADLPPLRNDLLATAINYKLGLDAGHPERVSRVTLNRIRDKGGEQGSMGASLEDLDAANAGERTRHQRDTSEPSAQAVKNRIDRHQPAGDVSGRNTADETGSGMGVSLDDMDGGD